MVEKTWPSLKSCKHQCYQAKDQLSQLPDDLLLLIMSSLTMKEAARTSVLSHKWHYLWRCFPVLIFKNDGAMKRLKSGDEETVLQERSNFLRWVNKVLEAHLGCTIDELRVAFDFDNSCQSHMDKWMAFAVAKEVKKIELDFTTMASHTCNSSPPRWNMSLYQPHNSYVFKSCLLSLCLRSVDITTEDVDCLLRTCMVLESLCINYSQSLVNVRVCDSPLQLKHLEVSDCPQLRTIDILAPKLLSFIHTGNPIELHIRNASLLSEVTVGNKDTGNVVAYAFDSLSKYFSQLEYLSWEIPLIDEHSDLMYNFDIVNPPAMTNLKHLKLHVKAVGIHSLLGWMDLIEASPLLQRLTVNVQLIDGMGRRELWKRNGRPLKSLTTLELCGDLGHPLDLEVAAYVIQNSIMLKDVYIEFIPLLGYWVTKTSIEEFLKGHIAKIRRMVPEGCTVHAKYSGSVKRLQECVKQVDKKDLEVCSHFCELCWQTSYCK